MRGMVGSVRRVMTTGSVRAAMPSAPRERTMFLIQLPLSGVEEAAGLDDRPQSRAPGAGDQEIGMQTLPVGFR